MTVLSPELNTDFGSFCSMVTVLELPLLLDVYTALKVAFEAASTDAVRSSSCLAESLPPFEAVVLPDFEASALVVLWLEPPPPHPASASPAATTSAADLIRPMLLSPPGVCCRQQGTA